MPTVYEIVSAWVFCDPVTGELWDTENKPFSGDEINLVEMKDLTVAG